MQGRTEAFSPTKSLANVLARLDNEAVKTAGAHKLCVYARSCQQLVLMHMFMPPNLLKPPSRAEDPHDSCRGAPHPVVCVPGHVVPDFLKLRPFVKPDCDLTEQAL